MAIVVTSRQIRDKMPRTLWELRLDCGHTHYEKAERWQAPPPDVVCRVCIAEARLVRYRKRVIQAIRAGMSMGDAALAAVGQLEFKLDGGATISSEPAPSPVESGERPIDLGSAAVPMGTGPRGPHALPACMRPHPHMVRVKAQNRPSERPRARARDDMENPQPAPRRRRRKGDVDGQERLFEG